MFTNDPFPRACTPDGGLQTEADWSVVPTRIRHGASIGSNATIICGITIGRSALVGAGRGGDARRTRLRDRRRRPGHGGRRRAQSRSLSHPCNRNDGAMIGIGVIGYGYWGPNLARSVSETDGCRLAGIADFSAAALARRQALPGPCPASGPARADRRSRRRRRADRHAGRDALRPGPRRAARRQACHRREADRRLLRRCAPADRGGGTPQAWS